MVRKTWSALKDLSSDTYQRQGSSYSLTRYISPKICHGPCCCCTAAEKQTQKIKKKTAAAQTKLSVSKYTLLLLLLRAPV